MESLSAHRIVTAFDSVRSLALHRRASKGTSGKPDLTRDEITDSDLQFIAAVFGL